MILFSNVTKKYPGDILALDNINFKIDDGEFVFLVGPSGAGKTSILRLLIRDLLPTHGCVLLDDFEVNKVKDSKLPYLRRKIGFVFQDFKLLADRTIAENISVSLEILNKSREEINKRIKEVLQIINLTKRADYFPKQLSFGERQRVAIGRAIAGEAKVFLADEPTGNLDPNTSWEILKIINQINKAKTTVIMATHNVDIVNSLKKRVISLSFGKITKDEKKSRYS